jgi:uncharacterized protein YegP (UPF0339 family)
MTHARALFREITVVNVECIEHFATRAEASSISLEQTNWQLVISTVDYGKGRKMMAYKFEVYKDKTGDFRFRFIASNGEKMFASQGYKQKRSAMSAIESIKKNAPQAAIDDQS